MDTTSPMLPPPPVIPELFHREYDAEKEGELEYLRLIHRILAKGYWRTGRNGKTISLFGEHLRFNLRGGRFPLLTTKRVPWRTMFRELKWFLLGRTDNKWLRDKGVGIWNGNAEAGPLWGGDSRGVEDLGPIYGFQWRHFGAKYVGCKMEDVDHTGIYPSNVGVDQVKQVVELLRRDPGTRRAIISAWNPAALPEMTLPPCHILSQYWVSSEGLHCHMYQRSADVGLGVPFNIASYSLLTHIIAHCVGLPAVELVMSFGDTHIYEEHVAGLTEQITREPFPVCHLRIVPPPETSREWSDIWPWEVEEDWIRVDEYVHSPTIKLPMIA